MAATETSIDYFGEADGFASKDGFPFRSLCNPASVQNEFVIALKGRYILLHSTLLFDIDRQVLVTPTQIHDWGFGNMGRMLLENEVADRIQYKLANAKGPSRNLPLLLAPYTDNYFHFTFECMAGLRLIDETYRDIGVRHDLLKFAFQSELMERCLGGRTAVLLDGSELHIDPILFFNYFSMPGVNFIRERIGKFAAPGNEIVLVERGTGPTTRLDPLGRAHSGSGTIVETPAWLALMEKLGVRRVHFGSGALNVSKQIALLDGARTIIASHGAAMTNITYLNPPMNIIELANDIWASRDQFKTISALLGFNYRKLVSPDVDERGGMIVDTEALAAIVEELHGAPV